MPDDRNGPIVSGEVIRGATVLDVQGTGPKGRVKLSCECTATFFRAYPWVQQVKRNGTVMGCNKCNRERSRKRATMWVRTAKPGEVSGG